MPVQYGPPTLPKPKPKPVLDPFGVPHVGPQAPNPPLGQYTPGAAPVATAIADQGGGTGGGGNTGGGGGGGGGNPFETDPGYLAALAHEQDVSQRLDAGLKAAREAAIVQFGDPSLAIPGYQVDPLTAAMAQQNTQSGNSTLAQLNRQRDLNQQGIQNQLAAHGIINSGALGYQTGQNQQNYGTELYNAQQSLLSALAGQAQDALSGKDTARAGSVGALTNAYDTYVANPQFWGAAGVDDGGAKAASNANAVAPVTTSLSMSGSPGNVGGATSKLAKKPMQNPYALRTAKQTVGYG